MIQGAVKVQKNKGGTACLEDQFAMLDGKHLSGARYEEQKEDREGARNC